MKARFRATCAKCHGPIEVGTLIAHPFGTPTWHLGCALAHRAARRRVMTPTGRLVRK